MNDIDLTAARAVIDDAIGAIKAQLNLPPARVVEPNALALMDAVEQLDKLLTLWADRDTDIHAPGVARQAATDAVLTIDFVSAQAYRMRERLIGQLWRYDNATAARVDALLAERNQT